jgi:hypothetical protein
LYSSKSNATETVILVTMAVKEPVIQAPTRRTLQGWGRQSNGIQSWITIVQYEKTNPAVEGLRVEPWTRSYMPGLTKVTDEHHTSVLIHCISLMASVISWPSMT